MSRDFLLYTAGPISGISYGQSVDWREYVAKSLPKDIQVVSPMRAKQYLSKETTLKDSYDTVLSCGKGITCRDRMDVMRCDMLFANLLGSMGVSIGTVMEIAWADMLRKPIVLVMENGSLHDHAIIRDVAGFIVPTLDEGIAVVHAVLLPR